MPPKFPLLLATRLDWGFGNPNKTAALIASLMLLVWVLPCLHRRLFWLALLFCTGLGGCLMQTASRGGIVAVLVASGILLARLPRPWPRAYVLGSMASFWIVLGIAAALPTIGRFGKAMGGQDLSILSRLSLWEAAPRMMADAPGGWGFGRSADVFHQWYQPVGQSQLFTSLINSHLTWLVEGGWPGGFLYVFAWLAVLTLCWHGSADVRSHTFLTIPFGLWVAFGITAWFNSVAESPWLWLAPLIGLGASLCWRRHTRQWPGSRQWLAIVSGSGVILVALLLAGNSGKHIYLRLHGSQVVVGGPHKPAVWLLVNRQILGDSYGQTLRRYLLNDAREQGQMASIGLVESLDDLPVEEVRGKTLAVSGTLADQQFARLKVLLPACAKLVLLNPAFVPQAVRAEATSFAKIEVVAGEFSEVSMEAWGAAVKLPLHIVSGAAEYLASWPVLLLTPEDGLTVNFTSLQIGKTRDANQKNDQRHS